MTKPRKPYTGPGPESKADRMSLADDEEQFQSVSGPASPSPEPPRFTSLDEAVDTLELYFQRSHGLSVDKAQVEEFVEYYRSLRKAAED